MDLSSANVSDVAAALTPTAYSTGTVGTATSTSFTVNGEEITFAAGASAADINTAIQGVFGATTDITAAVDGDGNITLASTATALDSVSDSAGASVAVTTTGGFSVTDNTAAQATIKALDAQIGKISTARANLGAYQNRFDHTINSVNVTMENLSASESRIRDTDMASEMVSFTNAQILSQAGTAMLAQANSIPQTVLQLLQ
ncbi:MAG: hypothetical protein LKI74_10360 [Actinomyces sp.]|nr:hypothetical protein [Actinomyces sp.]MCI1830931.1 hypothetical protein [Actinomyces sp.]